jgi:hypothetical protein
VLKNVTFTGAVAVTRMPFVSTVSLVMIARASGSATVLGEFGPTEPVAVKLPFAAVTL